MKTKKDHTDKQPAEAADETARNCQEALSAKEKEAQDNYEKYLRAVADLDNYRKRAAREKADTLKYGKEEIIRDILPFWTVWTARWSMRTVPTLRASRKAWRSCRTSFMLPEKARRGADRMRGSGV